MQIRLRNCDLFAYVNEEDYEWASQYKWRLDHKGYVVRTLPRGEGHGKELMHRAILQRMGHDLGQYREHGRWKQTDHKNGVRIDNRRGNLRIATSSQNHCNKKVLSLSKSGIKGVRQEKNGRWEATITLGGKDLWRKQFKTIEEAASARAAVLPLYHGEFARAE